MSNNTTATKTVTKTEEPTGLKKYIVAQSKFVADALKRKVTAFKDAEVITEYAGIRNKLLGAEVLGTQMDVSLADVAQVFHQCTLPINRDEVEMYSKLDADVGNLLIDAKMWSPRTFSVSSQNYSTWALQSMEAPKEELELEG